MGSQLGMTLTWPLENWELESCQNTCLWVHSPWEMRCFRMQDPGVQSQTCWSRTLCSGASADPCGKWMIFWVSQGQGSIYRQINSAHSVFCFTFRSVMEMFCICLNLEILIGAVDCTLGSGVRDWTGKLFMCKATRLQSLGRHKVRNTRYRNHSLGSNSSIAKSF